MLIARLAASERPVPACPGEPEDTEARRAAARSRARATERERLAGGHTNHGQSYGLKEGLNAPLPQADRATAATAVGCTGRVPLDRHQLQGAGRAFGRLICFHAFFPYVSSPCATACTAVTMGHVERKTWNARSTPRGKSPKAVCPSLPSANNP